MDYQFERVPVDAGLIVIADPDHYKPYGPTKRPPAYAAVIENGEYEVEWSMPGSWRSPGGKASLKITSGRMWVSDPCYMVADDKWETYLKEQIWAKEEAKEKPEDFIILRPGGDGAWVVLLKLTPVILTDVHGNVIYYECRHCKTYSFEEVVNGFCTEWCEEVLLNHDDNPNLSTIITDKGVFRGTIKDLKLFGKLEEA